MSEAAREVADREKIEAKAEELLRQMKGNPQRLADAAAKFWLAASRRAPEGELWVNGIVNPSGKPYVQIAAGDLAMQLDVESARAHAQLVLEAAANAVTEAALVEGFLAAGMDDRSVFQLITMVRDHRRDRWGAREEGAGGGDRPSADA